MAKENLDLEKRSVEERENDQFRELRTILDNAKQHSEGWKSVLSEIIPREILNKKDLQKIPITRKSELSVLQNKIPPLGGLTTKPTNHFKNLYVSPGPIYDPGGRNDFWRMSRAMRAASFIEGDIVYNTFSYHLTPAGEMMEQGANSIGACVIPGGIGNTEQQIQAINKLKPNRYVGTPSFLKTILEKGKESNIDVSSLKTGLVGGEACPPSLKNILSELGNNVIAAVLIVMIIILATLGFRNALLVGVAIPGSFLLGFIILNMLGITLNIIVLFSLLLSTISFV